ncbi:hypothetical protein [Aeropyrum pernix]|nr:hypothetical protein [Aeropyrum pernix]
MSLLKNYFSGYLSFMASEIGKALTKEKEDKRRLLTQAFSKEMLKEASDEEFAQILVKALSSLWAMAIWTKREQRINQIIERNGVKRLRDMFYDLIYGSGSLEERFDKFRANVWGLGVAAITEILCFVEPEKYAMWNKKVVSAIEKLGLLEDLAKTLGIRKDVMLGILSINGYQYARIIEFLDKLRTEMEQIANQKVDFLELDYFLYYVAEVAEAPVAREVVREEEERGAITSHYEAQYYLLKLGQLIGYATYVAKQDQGKIVNNERLGDVADVSELPQWLGSFPGIRNPEDIDVIWLDSTGERPVYAFEVSHTTDITKDATALRDLASITERVFIVAPDNRRGEFEKLKKSPQFKPLLIEGKLGFISYSELLSLYSRAKSLRELLDRVGIRI